MTKGSLGGAGERVERFSSVTGSVAFKRACSDTLLASPSNVSDAWHGGLDPCISTKLPGPRGAAGLGTPP